MEINNANHATFTNSLCSVYKSLPSFSNTKNSMMLIIVYYMPNCPMEWKNLKLFFTLIEMSINQVWNVSEELYGDYVVSTYQMSGKPY